MDDAEVGIVKGIFHHPEAATVPGLIELRDQAILWVSGLGNIGEGQEGIVGEANPGVAVAFCAQIGLDPIGFRNRRARIKLGHLGAGACAVVGPAVVGAAQAAVLHNAHGESGRTVAAAIAQGRRFPRRRQPQHQRLPQQREGLGAIGEIGDRYHRIPETSQHRFLGYEHGGC